MSCTRALNQTCCKRQLDWQVLTLHRVPACFLMASHITLQASQQLSTLSELSKLTQSSAATCLVISSPSTSTTGLATWILVRAPSALKAMASAGAAL